MTKQRLLNHVNFVIDRSGSMNNLNHQVNKVVRNQITRLDALDQQMGQETHVSIYIFGSETRCVIYDTDVKRLVGKDVLAGHYDGGMTSLIDAALTVREESAQIAQLHCDHAFLDFILTDGGENQSHLTARGRKYTNAFGASSIQAKLTQELQDTLRTQPDNVTVAVLVPDVLCKKQAINFGFPPGNIMIWDVSEQGLAVAEQEIAKVTSDYYEARATGTRGTNTLFASNVTQAQVDASGLKPVDPDQFMIIPVALASTSQLSYVIPKKSITKKNPGGIKHVEIMPFIQETGRTYVAGQAYYELVKSEKFEANKKVALIHRQTKKVYVGDQAKALIGLSGTSTRIRPQAVKGGDYDIFVQSTSVNRHLPLGTRVLIFK